MSPGKAKVGAHLHTQIKTQFFPTLFFTFTKCFCKVYADDVNELYFGAKYSFSFHNQIVPCQEKFQSRGVFNALSNIKEGAFCKKSEQR